MQHLYDNNPLVFTAIALLLFIGVVLVLTILTQKRLPKCNVCGTEFKEWPTMKEYYMQCPNHDCKNVLFYDGTQVVDEEGHC